jgi:transcriptional regulator with XRE-family HTH domain
MKITGSKAKIVGRNIKYARNSKGLSQNQLAKKIGCSRVYINRIELGKVIFSQCIIREISRNLKVPYESLFAPGYGKQLKTATDDFLKKKYYFPGGYAKVYWALGFIFGDATLRDTSSPTGLIISHFHPEPLEKIRQIFRVTYTVGKTKNRNKIRWHLGIYDTTSDGKTVINYLRYALGFIKPRGKRIFPDIPEEYLPHFIRGFFDAHGTCYLQKARKRIFIKLSYQSRKFMETIVNILFQIEIVKSRPAGRPLTIYPDLRAEHYYIKILTKRNVKKFFSYVYQNSNPKMRDERNYKRFCKKLEKAEE